MKIEDLKNRPGSRSAGISGGSKAGASGKTEKSAETGFAEQVGRFVRGDRRSALDKLLARIDASAGRLSGEFTFENLYTYKADVGKFLRAALDEAFEPVQTEGKAKSGKSKKLMTARIVNETIQALIDEVIRRQGPVVGYMDRLDEIRGLLVDLYE